MKRLITLFSLAILAQFAYSQLTGTKNIPGDYPDLAAAIADLNTQGVGSGGVTLNLLAGNPQTAPAGGYVIGNTGSLVLTTTSSSNQVIIQGNSNTITAFTPQASGVLNDAIFKVIGADWITIKDFNMQENASNTTTTAASNNMTEWGVALLYVTTTDGAQNNTIKNNTIDLNRTYQNTFGIYSNSTHSATSISTSATATGPLGGNHGLVIVGNTITDVNNGIVVVGPTAAADMNEGLTIGGSVTDGNNINNYGTTATFSSYANVSGTVNGILARNTRNFNISYNSVSSSNGGVTSGTLNGIQSPAFSNAPSGTFTNSISNNTISLRSGAATGAMNGINCPSGSASTTSTININNNDFHTWGHTVTASGTIIFILNASTHFNQNITYNTFTNITVNTTGSVTFLSNSNTLPAGGTKNVNNNSIVTAFTKTGAGGTVTLFTDNGSDPSGTVNNVNSNNFSNITVTGATTIAGVSNTNGGSPTKSVSNNTLANWTGGTSAITGMTINWDGGTATVSGNNINTFINGGAITGIAFGTSGAGTTNAFQNVIHSFTGSGTGTISAFSVGGTTNTTRNVYRNSIYNLENSNAGGFVNGILVSSGTTNNIYNNFISDLRTPAANAANPLIGLSVTGGTTNNIFFNSIYLNATSTGGLFGSSGISVSTTPTVDMRNNVIVNVSAPNGTGVTAAYRRSTTTLTSYSSNSNANCYYAGATEDATHAVFFDGTTPYNMAGFKALVGPTRDAVSFRELPPFVNVSSTPYDLHMQTTVGTQCESGGVAVTSPINITDDYDGNTRSATPDVGADEFNGIGIDLSAPAISYTLLGNGVVAATRPFPGVNITDASGVNTASGTAPRVYYKRSTDANAWNDNTSSTDGWKWKEANGTSTPFDFTIDYSLLNGGTGIITGDVIQYFVVAQDLAGTPNVGINTGTFAAAPASVALTAAAFPIGGTLNSYTIVASISGTKTVGSGGDYPSLTGAGGLFEDINAKVVAGDITTNVISNLTEDGANALNQWAESGTGNYTLTIKPNDASLKTISGSYAGGLIRLNGADRVTFDGRYTGGGNYLSFSNTSTATNTAVFHFISMGTNAGATDNTIRNCDIAAGSNTITSTFGIFSGSSSISTSGTGADNDNLTILENVITTCYYGIYARGVATTGLLDGIVITGNSIGSANTSNYVIFRGVDIQNAASPVISQNVIFNLQTSTGVNVAGIDLGQNVSNAIVSRNMIYGLRSTSTSGYGAYGINISSSSGTTNIRIDNNVIYDIITANYSNTNTTWNAFGIRITGGTNHKVYYNSVNLFGDVTSGSNAGMSSAFIVTSSSTTGIDLRNNIFSNSTNFAITGSKSYAAYVASGTTFATIDFNDYYASGTHGLLGYYGADKADLIAWQTASSQDPSSISADPMFVSGTNLQPMSSSPLIAAGTPISGILKDILNIDRDAINPTIGAYEEGFFVPCPPPSGLQASNITTTSALLGWTPGGTEPMWSIEVGTPGFTPGTGNAILSEYYTTDNPWTASPLAPSTDYEFYVQAYCNGFENPKVDYFWMAMPSLGFLDPGQSGGTANDPDETGVWYEYEDDETGLSWWNIWFYNDPLDKNRMKKVRMGFWVQPIVAGPPSWINYVINWSDSTWVLPGFPMPADELFVVRSPLNDSVISGLTWIELLFVIPDFNPEWVSVDIWGENIQILQESPEPYPMTSPLAAYWLGPLSPGGVIVHECLPKGHNTSSWSGPKPFTTACGSVTTFPFTESFDGTTFPPACWLSQKITGSDPGTWKRVTAGTNPVCAPYSGAGMIEYDSYLYSSGTKGILVTPPLNIPNEFFKVNFWMYRSGTYSNLDSVAVFYNTAPNLEGATLLGVAHRWIGADPVVPSNGWYEFSFNFPSGATGDGRYIIFEGISRYGNDIYVDEVTISGATAPLFTANPASKDFGECPLNNLSAEYYTQSFEIRNDGPGTITLTGASIIGTNAGEFELTDLNSYNLDLTYGNPIYVSVKFNPATVGNKSATLRFSSPSRADYDIPLAGAAYVAPAQNLTGQTTAAYTNELQWDPPMPEGEIRFDNGIASGFWWVANPSTANHYFFTRFTAPISGNLDFVAFFTRKSSGGPNWNQVLVCPEIGTTNTPDLANPIATFSGVTVTSTTGEWIILELSPSASLSNGDDFFLVTRWPEGSTAGPFIAADATSNFGRCAYTDDSGTNWYNANTSWLMRAYMSVAARETIALTSGIANPQLENLPVIAASEVTKPEWAQKVTNLSVPVPGIFVSNTGQRALLSYDVLRGTAANSLTALATGVPDTEYDDNDPNLVPGTQYFYGVIAVYTGSQLSDTSNVIGLTLSPSPGITYTPLANTHLTTARTLAATITGKGGVPQSGTGLPVCYWKKGQGGSWTSAQGVHDSGNLYNFSFGSGVTGGDTVYYYLVAQDNGTPPNVLANPSAGAGNYSFNPPAAATPPTVPNSYRITDSYSGNLKVGTGEQFESLTGAAGLFASINNAVVIGNITVEITTNLTEPGTVGLNQWTEITDGTYSLTIKPDAAVNRTISGNYAGALIRLNGADGVIIDGSYGGGGRYLTFENLDASNSNITIALSNNANNNSILNCNIYSKYRAVTLTSTSTTTIEGNNIYGDVAGNSNYSQAGVFLGTSALNTIVAGNTIHDFYFTGTDGWGTAGIRFETGDATTITYIYNNLIYNIKADGWQASASSFNPNGIYLGSGGNVRIYNNSIYLSGNVLSSTYTVWPACITIASGVTTLEIRNNILQNSLQLISGSQPSKTYAVLTAGTNAQFTNINHNDYFVNGVSPNIGRISTVDYANLGAWQTGTGQDGKSIAADPLYLGTTNLQLQTSPQSPAIGKAIPILPLVGKDYAGNTRNPIKPTMGAYDYNPADFFTWTGTTDTDWNTSTNWSPATVPGLNDDAYVPPVPSGNPLNFPIVPVAGGPFSVDELYVGPGASVTVPDGATLNVKNTNP